MKLIKYFVFLALIGNFILINSCGLNQNPPSYIKDVVAYKEGSDGIVVYFVLADSNGQPTTANGKVNIKITETRSEYNSRTYTSTERIIDIFSNTYNVTTSDFQNAEVGQGAFKRKVVLFLIGRIPYSRFRNKPEASNSGKIEIEFETSSGRKLTGSDTIFF